MTGMDVMSMTPGPEYWERVKDGSVPYQHCETCGESVFFPRVLCQHCGSTRLVWKESTGEGTVYSATSIHTRDAEPYTVALIDLEEGIRVMARIDDAEPDNPPIGAAVRVVASEIDGQPALAASLNGGNGRG